MNLDASRNDGVAEVEVDFLLSYDGEGLEDLVKNKTF